MLSQCICYISDTYQILSPVLFQQSLYFPFLIHRIFFIYLSLLFFYNIRREHSSRSFAPPKKMKCARRSRARAGVRSRKGLETHQIFFYGRAVYYPNYGTRPPHNGREVRAASPSCSTLDASSRCLYCK